MEMHRKSIADPLVGHCTTIWVSRTQLYRFTPLKSLEAIIPLLLLVLLVAKEASTSNSSEENHLEEKPAPTTTLSHFRTSCSTTLPVLRGSVTSSLCCYWIVQVPRLQSDDVEVVRQFAGMCAEAQICCVGHFEWLVCCGCDSETIDPGIWCLVL
jgi:hypothetical protein